MGIKKTFLIVSAVFPPEPVVSANLSNDLAIALSKKTDVLVITPRPTRPAGFSFEAYVPKNKFKFKQVVLNSYTCPESSLFGRLRESISFGLHCAQFLKNNHQQISQIYSNSWPLFAQFFLIRTAQKYQIPVTIHVQDIYPEALSNKSNLLKPFIDFLLMPFDRFNLRIAKSIIAISEKMKIYLASTRKVSPEKIVAISNWQDVQLFSMKHINVEQSFAKSPFTFMYLGNVGPVAGVNLLIEAFAKADLCDARLIIAGSGTMIPKLQNQAKVFSSAQIEFWPVPNGKVQEVQNQANVMLLPMKKGAGFSSIPSKLPSYLFSAKPVIACVDKGSDIEIAVTVGKFGWTSNPEDSDMLAILMRKVYIEPTENLVEMGMKGCNFAMQHYSKAKNLKKMVSVLLDKTTLN